MPGAHSTLNFLDCLDANTNNKICPHLQVLWNADHWGGRLLRNIGFFAIRAGSELFATIRSLAILRRPLTIFPTQNFQRSGTRCTFHRWGDDWNRTSLSGKNQFHQCLNTPRGIAAGFLRVPFLLVIEVYFSNRPELVAPDPLQWSFGFDCFVWFTFN